MFHNMLKTVGQNELKNLGSRWLISDSGHCAALWSVTVSWRRRPLPNTAADSGSDSGSGGHQLASARISRGQHAGEKLDVLGWDGCFWVCSTGCFFRHARVFSTYPCPSVRWSVRPSHFWISNLSASLVALREKLKREDPNYFCVFSESVFSKSFFFRK